MPTATRRRPELVGMQRASRAGARLLPRRSVGAASGEPAVEALGPLLDALGEAGHLSPRAASHLLRRAVAGTLGWRARLVPAAAPLASEARVSVADGAALVPVAAGARALWLAGGSREALRRVADLCAQALAQARCHPHEPGRRSGQQGLPRVLLVGEDPHRRAALARLLEPAHVVVHAADTGTAIELARAGRLDAAVLALATGRDALRALARLRSSAESADLPSIAMASPDDETTRIGALELGADFLGFPCSESELQARLDRAIRLGQATRALRDEALTDPLTGLANRRALENRLHEELRRARRYRTPLTCIMADLDGLKAINDALGHASGDQALQATAGVLIAELRETDFAARAGGDEFVLLLPHTTARAARVLAERIRHHLRTVRIGPSLGSRAVEVSLGVAQLGPGGDGEALVEAADRALYAAKRAGRVALRPARRRARPTPRLRG